MPLSKLKAVEERRTRFGYLARVLSLEKNSEMILGGAMPLFGTVPA